MSLYSLSCTFSCDFIKRTYFFEQHARHERCNHQDTLAPPRMANTGLAGVSKTLAKALSSCARTFQKKTQCKTSWCILLIHIDSYRIFYLSSSTIFYHLLPSSIMCVAWGQLASCSVILQRSLPIRSPAHFTSKPSPTSEAVLRTEYLMNFTVAQWCMVVPTDAYLCLLMPAADA